MRRSTRFASVGLVMLVGAGLVACSSDDSTDTADVDAATTTTATAERQDDVADAGAEVMPFDLETTTHVFENTETGGLQEVVADDPADTEQIELIRDHLRLEARKFRHGDFNDPAAIHGDDMPGLAVLRDRYTGIVVLYEELPAGASITYTAEDPEVVDAIHQWFDAQLEDHGAHAEPG